MTKNLVSVCEVACEMGQVESFMQVLVKKNPRRGGEDIRASICYTETDGSSLTRRAYSSYRAVLYCDNGMVSSLG